jgi:transposase
MVRPSPSDSRERFHQLYALYLDGHSYRALGRRFGISGERVRQILNEYASPDQRGALQDEIFKRRDTSWQTTEIHALLDAGHSCRSVAAALNLSVHRIKRISAERNRRKRTEPCSV